jgi:hypothetical protein
MQDLFQPGTIVFFFDMLVNSVNYGLVQSIHTIIGFHQRSWKCFALVDITYRIGYIFPCPRSSELAVFGLRFVIWPNDHDPAHVHVFSAEAEAKIELGEPDGHPRLIDNRRMKRSDLSKALNGVFEHRALLMEQWRKIHG